ncbi:MAG: hypothetical protein BAA04_08130 [Firmicutes bacterium ZCTH02-B6]|nr:MAG: hypothetical protein BAA04_08130 [Firmicutes bacterium ZCTH02-B6]
MGAWKYLEGLCRLGPRGSATEGERQAAQWIAARLEELGYEVEIQPFMAPRHTLYAGPAAVMAGVLAARWLAAWSEPFAAGVMILLLVPLVGEMLGSRVNFDLILPKRPSQNVVARLPGTGTGKPVVITAHYDTQRGSWLFAPGFRPWLRPFFVSVYAALALVPLGTLSAWAFPAARWIPIVAGAATVWVAASLVFLLLSWLTGRYVEGANDNGSGVAVALALAERWLSEPVHGVAPVFLFTGCEETGLRGMRRFLATPGLPRDTVFLNLDNVGGGRLHYLLGEGMLLYRRYDKELVAAARAVAQEFGDEIRPLPNLLLPTDALAAAVGGYPAITLLAAGAGGAIPNYHWHTDVMANVDRHVVELTENYAWRLLTAIARRPEGLAALAHGQGGRRRTGGN